MAGVVQLHVVAPAAAQRHPRTSSSSIRRRAASSSTRPRCACSYDQCVARQRDEPDDRGADHLRASPGSPIYRMPPHDVAEQQPELQRHGALGRELADAIRLRAAALRQQIVSLQRDLHDWRAIFAFTQSPNGSFAFNFLISLKAEPDLKFDYHKATYRNEGHRVCGEPSRSALPRGALELSLGAAASTLRACRAAVVHRWAVALARRRRRGRGARRAGGARAGGARADGAGQRGRRRRSSSRNAVGVRRHDRLRQALRRRHPARPARRAAGEPRAQPRGRCRRRCSPSARRAR